MKSTGSLRERFEEKIMADPNSGCWLWTGCMDAQGYGFITLGTREQGVERAHRVSLMLAGKEVPAKLHVRHKCNNPSCVNPNHLVVGTASDNAHDALVAGKLFYDPEKTVIAGHPEKRAEIKQLYGLGYTQDRIAEMLDTSQATVSRAIYYREKTSTRRIAA